MMLNAYVLSGPAIGIGKEVPGCEMMQLDIRAIAPSYNTDVARLVRPQYGVCLPVRVLLPGQFLCRLDVPERIGALGAEAVDSESPIPIFDQPELAASSAISPRPLGAKELCI